ncbi:right-handed parallel beta-helix repeat-containing protein [bacterium]|nr:right-handed parallel beta-helix repeat-containing protein [bacterium]
MKNIILKRFTKITIRIFLGMNLTIYSILLFIGVETAIAIVNPGESIQAAVNALPAEGGIVELAAGVFDITGEAPILIYKNNVAIRGQGMDKTELVYNGFPPVFSPGMAAIYAEDIENVELSNFHIYATDPNGASISAGIAIHFMRCTNVIVSYVKAEHFRGGMQTNALGNEVGWTVDNMTVSDCIFTNNYAGAGNVFTINSKFLRNEFSNNYAHCGLEFNSGCDNNLIEDNLVHHNQYGLKFYVGNDNNIYRNNTIYNNQAGIYGQNIRDGNVITNNFIYDNSGWGIAIEGPAPYGYVVTITLNTIVNSGVGLYNSNYVINAENNIFVNNALSGNIQSSYNNFWNSGTPSGTGDISIEPLFADLTNHDFHLKSTEGRWNGSTWVTDSISSLCIDAGNPDSAYSNEPSPNGNGINMGAYGNTTEASLSSGEDLQAPIISSVQAKEITANSSKITWITNEPSDSMVEYGINTNYGSSLSNAGFVLDHNVNLINLNANTTYHYRVQSKDAKGNIGVSAPYSFITSTGTSSAITTPPVISNVRVTDISSITAVITWQTDKAAISQIEYGRTITYGISTALETTLLIFHHQTLTGLSPETSYHFRIKSMDEKGNWGISEDYTFTTTLTKDNLVIIYPNPWIGNKRQPAKIHFSNLPKEAILRIFTISGTLLKTIEHKNISDGGSEEWDISNIASGIYIYYIESLQGEKKGKVSVVK